MLPGEMNVDFPWPLAAGFRGPGEWGGAMHLVSALWFGEGTWRTFLGACRGEHRDWGPGLAVLGSAGH